MHKILSLTMSDRSRDITPCANEYCSERGVHSPRQLAWHSTMKFDGTEKFVMTGSVDGCIILPETQFVGTHLHVDTTRALAVGGFPHPIRAAGERAEFYIKSPFRDPLLIFP